VSTAHVPGPGRHPAEGRPFTPNSHMHDVAFSCLGFLRFLVQAAAVCVACASYPLVSRPGPACTCRSRRCGEAVRADGQRPCSGCACASELLFFCPRPGSWAGAVAHSMCSSLGGAGLYTSARAIGFASSVPPRFVFLKTRTLWYEFIEFGVMCCPAARNLSVYL